MIAAIAPFMQPERDEPKTSADGRREQFGELLTVLKNASFSDVVEECSRTRYTHIHILAHGGEDEGDATSHEHLDEPRALDVLGRKEFAAAAADQPTRPPFEEALRQLSKSLRQLAQGDVLDRRHGSVPDYSRQRRVSTPRTAHNPSLGT